MANRSSGAATSNSRMSGISLTLDFTPPSQPLNLPDSQLEQQQKEEMEYEQEQENEEEKANNANTIRAPLATSPRLPPRGRQPLSTRHRRESRSSSHQEDDGSEGEEQQEEEEDGDGNEDESNEEEEYVPPVVVRSKRATRASSSAAQLAAASTKKKKKNTRKAPAKRGTKRKARSPSPAAEEDLDDIDMEQLLPNLKSKLTTADMEVDFSVSEGADDDDSEDESGGQQLMLMLRQMQDHRDRQAKAQKIKKQKLVQQLTSMAKDHWQSMQDSSAEVFKSVISDISKVEEQRKKNMIKVMQAVAENGVSIANTQKSMVKQMDECMKSLTQMAEKHVKAMENVKGAAPDLHKMLAAVKQASSQRLNQFIELVEQKLQTFNKTKAVMIQ